ncbi:MFS general substrate transporter [Ophiobolus disseminans]|uniref:MFS general substrate transporter n=1 Tax=Ophiobolus disseminans TaxID=1469910 RepID=A0A6A6ZYK1_9PLEO|nr:MFS general substrate transporter [Ophiobolus disseminans]
MIPTLKPGVKLSDEATPLLADTVPAEPSIQASQEGEGPLEHDASNRDDEDIPLPRKQIFLLCYTAVVEPIAFFGIFPYINFMIEKVGNVKKEDVGFYSGLIESLFSVTQMCVMILWGKASDKYGRKPILVLSLVGVAFTTALFGMSQSLWQMIVARCCAGVFAGTVVTVRAMLSESTTKHTQARAFSYFAFARNLGLFVGPIIGGVLERPAEKYKGSFGRIEFFHHYPYALPSVVTSLIALSAAITTLVSVKETRPAQLDNKKTDEPPLSIWQLLKSPGVARVVLIYNYVMCLAFTFTAVNPVYMYTPIELGGIGFSPELIAAFTALSGFSQAIWLLLVFPRLHKRVGTGQVLRYCAYVWPVFFASTVGFNALLRHDIKTAFWSTAPPIMVIGSGVCMAFTAVQLAINDIAPSPETVGILNSVVLAIQSGVRAVAPILATCIYATGVKYHILWGHLFWLLNVILALGLIVLLRLLPAKAAGGPHPSFKVRV